MTSSATRAGGCVGAEVSRDAGESALLYVSECARPHPAAIRRIVDVSKVRNERDRITGLLMFDGRHFAQWVEGPAGSMDRLLQRLRADPRHRQMDVLWFESPGLGRRFPTWAFGCLALEPGARAIERLRGTRGVDAMLSFGDLIREAARAHRWPQPRMASFVVRADPFAASRRQSRGAARPAASSPAP